MDIKKEADTVVEFFSLLKKSAILASFEIKSQNREKMLGVLWYVLEPLTFFWVIMLMKQHINFPQGEIYPIYLFIGLAFFNFFRRATSSALGTFSKSVNYIRNMTMPVIPMIFAEVLVAAYMHLFEMVILVGLLIYFQISLWHLVLYFCFFILFIIFTLGVSLILSVGNVFIKDISSVWSIAVRILWFSTPVFYYYKTDTVLSKLNYFLNPLFHYLSAMREAIKNGALTSNLNLIGMILTSAAVLVFGLLLFKTYRKYFADFI